MTFFIPYILFVILIASSGVIGEYGLGRLTGSGPVGAFGYATKRLGKPKLGERLGIIPVLGSLCLAIGYTCVMGWIFKYAFMAIDGKLVSLGTDINRITNTFANTSSSFSNNGWIIIAGVVSLVIMSLGIAKGIERVNKILMPILFFLLLGLGIYICLLYTSPSPRD